MKVIIGADKKGKELKDKIIQFFEKENIEYLDVDPMSEKNFIENSKMVAECVLEDLEQNRGILIDEFGAGSFMVVDKFKYIICAELNDEHSAKMTRDHNNANVITLGSGVVGEDVAINIVKRFIRAEYAGGRHQIRVDMLNKMC